MAPEAGGASVGRAALAAGMVRTRLRHSPWLKQALLVGVCACAAAALRGRLLALDLARLCSALVLGLRWLGSPLTFSVWYVVLYPARLLAGLALWLLHPALGLACAAL